MKAMLLAAGRGERMRPLTDHTAKPLLKANGTRLIEFHLQKLANAGYTDVVINTSWHGEKITGCIGDGSRYGLSITYSHEPEALETAGGIANALPLLGDDPFLIISTDIWCDINFHRIETLPMDALARLILVNNPAHHSAGDFRLDNNRVLPGTGQQTYTYSGIGIYCPTLFEKATNKKMPLREVLYPAIEKNQICGQYYAGKWMDIGTPQRLALLNDYLTGNS